MQLRRIDVRQPREFAAGHIAGTELVPLGTLGDTCRSWDPSAPIELVCKSGMRAGLARKQLLKNGFTNVSVLQGGVDARRAAGKPLVHEMPADGTGQVHRLDRQVLIFSGAVILLSLALGKFFSPRFYELSVFIAIWMAVDAFTGRGRTASLLARLPWNRKVSDEAQLP